MKIGIATIDDNKRNSILKEASKYLDVVKIKFSECDKRTDPFMRIYLKALKIYTETFGCNKSDNNIYSHTIYELIAEAIYEKVINHLSHDNYLVNILAEANDNIDYDVIFYLPYKNKNNILSVKDKILYEVLEARNKHKIITINSIDEVRLHVNMP